MFAELTQYLYTENAINVRGTITLTISSCITKGFLTSHTVQTIFFLSRLINYVILYLTPKGRDVVWLASDLPVVVPATPSRLSLYIIRVSLPLDLNSHLQATGQELHVMAEEGATHTSQPADSQINLYTP